MEFSRSGLEQEVLCLKDREGQPGTSKRAQATQLPEEARRELGLGPLIGRQDAQDGPGFPSPLLSPITLAFKCRARKAVQHRYLTPGMRQAQDEYIRLVQEAESCLERWG